MCIIGGGWAGLAAAVELTRRQIPVHLIESAGQPGGRARSICFDNKQVDNGQHLMTGACRNMLALMSEVGVDLTSAFHRSPLTLRLQNGVNTSLYLKTQKLPAPLHLFTALLRARGLSFKDRLMATRFGYRLNKIRLLASEDISVEALLHSERQSPALVQKLWQPLCISILNTPISEASARIFLRVLCDTFVQHRSCSDLMLAKKPLAELLPLPCSEYLQTHGARISLGQRVTAIGLNGSSVDSVWTGQQQLPASQVILATPHVITQRLLLPHRVLSKTCSKLAKLSDEPVATLYLQYPADVQLPEAMLGLEGTTAQWIFDRRFCKQAGLMAVVVSARGEHTGWSTQVFTTNIIRELKNCFPHWPAPQQTLLVREKRATFSCRAGVDNDRPGYATAVKGLWLAGDYTDNGLPATLEGAVRSGIECAKTLLQTYQ